MTALADDPLFAVMVQQTDLVLDTTAALDDAGVYEPSLLPGWSRGHVLAHLARNADGFANIARSATTGVQVPMYVSRPVRDADIERDAGRSLAAHLGDLRDTAQQLHRAMSEVPSAAGDEQVPTGMGSSTRVADLPWLRLREVAYHHVDLGCGFTFADLPDVALRAGLLECRTRLDVGLTARCRLADGDELVLTLGDGGPAVSGPAGAVLAWLTGRTMSAGTGADVVADVVADSGGPLPAVPSWG